LFISGRVYDDDDDDDDDDGDGDDDPVRWSCYLISAYFKQACQLGKDGALKRQIDREREREREGMGEGMGEGKIDF
jgi:hypothetical protein